MSQFFRHRRGGWRRTANVFLGVALLLTVFVSPFPSFAQTSTTPAATPADGDKKEDLSLNQETVAARYQRFENTLQQLAENMRKTDPARAELLMRAIGKSKETRIPDQMSTLVELLKKQQLGDAVGRQEELIQQMTAVLLLLQSEDRRDEIEREKARIQDLIKNLEGVIGRQQDARASNERGANASEVERQQQSANDAARKLQEKIAGQDRERGVEENPGKKPGEPSESSSGENVPSGKEPQDGNSPDSKGGKNDKPGAESEKNSKNGNSEKNSDPTKGDDSEDGSEQKQPGEEKPNPGEESKGDAAKPPMGQDPMKAGSPGKGSGKPSSPQDSQESQPSGDQSSPQDQPSQESSDSSQSSPQAQQPQKSNKTPGRDELEKARDEMERAIQELKKQNRKRASNNQDKALNELLKAKEKLEEILRQLREEERELMLAALEARFREMLGQQVLIYNGTVGLAAAPASERTDRHRIRAVEFARQEDQLAVEAAKALTLLQEEGSSIAFPEALQQIRADMLNVARLLEKPDVGDLTQGTERDIIEALEELVEALRQEMEKMKDKKQQQQQQQQQSPQQQALVNQLAELKLLRSLQFRINRRTKRLGHSVDGEQASQPEVVEQLRQLADRQRQIQQATYDLASGKNK